MEIVLGVPITIASWLGGMVVPSRSRSPSSVPPVRHRPGHQPHPGLRAPHRAPRGGLCGRRRWSGRLLNPVTGESALAVAASTLAVAALFQPAAAMSKLSWIDGSTAAATTRPGPSRPSASGYAIRWSWTCSRPSCSPSSTRRCNRRRVALALAVGTIGAPGTGSSARIRRDTALTSHAMRDWSAPTPELQADAHPVAG